MNKKTAKILIITFSAIASILIISINWLYANCGNLAIEEIVFHLKVPMKGTNTDLVWKYLAECPWKIVVLAVSISIILIYATKKTEEKKKINMYVGISAIILVISLGNVLWVTDAFSYIANQINDSILIEEEYVNPEEVAIQFPEEKRNLIYIFLESMETTFYSEENGGLSEYELIPEIAKLAKENEDFSNTKQLGGAYSLYGTTWTVAAMTAQTCGVPLKIGVDGNTMNEYSSFLDGAHSIGEILEDNGYNNFLLLGSDAAFGGRKNLFEQHGNYEIWDLASAFKEHRISEMVWWGYSDDNLFKFAKEKILHLSEQEEPFNFTMLTVDTHFQDGYKCKDCPDKWEQQYENVISCSSQKVGEFVNWIKQQDFYENTTIVIVGDHLSMQTDFFELEEEQKYDKKVINIIINPAIEPVSRNRMYSTFDLYPTTLAALGATIEGNKLALGTNIFSEEKTLIEKYGLEYLNTELKKVSKFYDTNILVEEGNEK